MLVKTLNIAVCWMFCFVLLGQETTNSWQILLCPRSPHRINSTATDCAATNTTSPSESDWFKNHNPGPRTSHESFSYSDVQSVWFAYVPVCNISCAVLLCTGCCQDYHLCNTQSCVTCCHKYLHVPEFLSVEVRLVFQQSNTVLYCNKNLISLSFCMQHHIKWEHSSGDSK